jgi:WD40 repeat protein
LESVLNITGTAAGSTTTKLKLPASGLSVTSSPDQTLVAVGGRFDGLQIFDAKTLTSLPTVPRVGDVTSLTYAQDCKTIFSGHKDGTIRYERFDDHNVHVIRAHTGQVMSILLLEEFNLGLSIDEDSDIAIWYISDGTLIGRLFTTGLSRKKNGRRTARLVLKQNGRQRTLQTVIEVPRYYILEYQLLPPNSFSVQVD